MARALPFVDYTRGRLVVACPECDETLDILLTVRRLIPRHGMVAPEVLAEPVEHICK